MLKILKNKYLHLVLVLILGLMFGLYFGYHQALSVLKQQFDTVKTLNELARYVITRDIAIALKKKNYDLAKCLTDLEASHQYDNVRQCMDNKRCSTYILKDVKERTPEILSNKHSSFDYLSVKHGIRRCDKSSLTPPSSGAR